MNGFFIHTDAGRAGEAIDLWGSRFGTVFSQHLEGDLIQFARGNTDADCRRHRIERGADDLSNYLQLFEFGGGLN